MFFFFFYIVMLARLPEATSLPQRLRFALRDAVNYLHKENRTFEAAKMLARSGGCL